MTADDLSTPLGQGKAPKRQRRALPAALPQALAGGLGLFLIAFAAWAMIADDPFGGEPLAVVSTTPRAEGPGGKADESGQRPGMQGNADRPNRYDGPGKDDSQPSAAPPGSKTVTIIDGSSGKRQEVVLPGSADGKTATGEQRLAEPSRHGAIPKIAPDGIRPADAFAHSAKVIPGKPNAPQIAIVIGGLGISATGTSDALAKLPPAVTFAFAPYVGGVDQLAARARDSGHELLLQVPMEPLDYPDNDPGPQTLLTALDGGQNVDRLQWLMSRFQGYVGVINYMGARFTASEQALAPVLREASKRGLIYVDDGSSPRSLASQIAGANNLAFAKADVAIDSVPAPADLDRALARLETAARERGLAIGVANALPVSIERIAKWAKGAEGRGFVLVPISAVANKPKSS